MESFEINDWQWDHWSHRSGFPVFNHWEEMCSDIILSHVFKDLTCLFAMINSNNCHLYGIRKGKLESGWMSVKVCVCWKRVSSTHHLPPSGLWPRRWRQASLSNPSISMRWRCTSVTSWASPPSQLSATPSRWSTYSMTSTHSLMLSLDCTMSTRWVLGDFHNL